MPKTINFERMSEQQLRELFELDTEILSVQQEDVFGRLLETSLDVVGKKRSW